MSEDRVTEALQALRSADFDVGIDGEAEVRTLLKFRRQLRRRRWRRVAMASAIAAAMMFAALHRPAHETRPMVAVAAAPIKAPPRVKAMAASPPQRHAVRKRELEEVVTPFFPLLPSASPFESGLLLRMTVPASAMRNVGLPVEDDRLSDPVLADVLVGQDDLARAIRFVSYE